MIRAWDTLVEGQVSKHRTRKEEKILISNKLIYSDRDCQVYTWSDYLDTIYLSRDFSYLNKSPSLRRAYTIITSVISRLSKRVPILIYIVDDNIELNVVYNVNMHQDNTVIKIHMYISAYDVNAFDTIVSYWKSSFSSAVSPIHTQIYYTNEFPSTHTRTKLPKIYKLNDDVAMMMDSEYILAVCECCCMDYLHVMNILSAIQLPNFGDKMIKEIQGGR